MSIIRNTTSIIAYVLATSAACGAVADREHATFSALCTDQQATGFTWRNGVWSQASFSPTTYVIEKRSTDVDTDCATDLAARQRQSDLSLMDTPPYHFTYGCYNLRRYVAQFYPMLDRVCQEMWVTDGADTRLARVDCTGDFETMSFAPSGNYNYSRINTQIDTDGSARKDSLIVSVGTCSVTREQ